LSRRKFKMTAAILSLTHGAPLLPENAGPAAVKKGSL
jgi:hypothetical protein